MGQLATVPIASIRENPVALRNVNREAEDYLGLVDSMREKGFFGAITVRERTDEETSESYYELVDGLHRYNAAKDAGIEEINVDIISLDDAQVLEAQIMANIHKVETKPVEYSRQLRRILSQNPLMTEAELASKLGKSPAWIKARLSLNKITNERVNQLIDSGDVVLSNAYALAKLPEDELGDWVDRAMTQPPDEFIPAVDKRVKEIKEAERKGRDAKPAEFQPVAVLRKLREIKEEAESGQNLTEVINTQQPKDMLEAAILGVKWAINLDPLSIEAQKKREEERKQQREEAKKQRDAKKAKKKARKQEFDSKIAAYEAENSEAVARGEEPPHNVDEIRGQFDRQLEEEFSE